jgi:hypothetical protein
MDAGLNYKKARLFMIKLKQWLVAAIAVFMLGAASLSPAQVLHEETRTGTASNSPTVTTVTSLTGMNGHLYMAAITSKPKLNVIKVEGLGLNWTPVKVQCSGRNATSVQIWMAQGTPTGNTVVTATFSDSAKNAILAVSRYSGVHATVPLGNVISGNTNGTSGACTGGVDNSSYSFNLTTTADGAAVYGAVSMRTKTHAPGSGYVERAELIKGSGGDVVSLAAQDKSVPLASAVAVDGTFNGAVDWAVVAVEIRPANASGGATKFTLTTSTVGSGSVNLDPTGGTYDAGTEVTLTATAATGFAFSDWSGDVASTVKSIKVVMNSNKHVTATFTVVIPQYRLNVNTLGNGSVNINPPGGVYNAGTVVTLTAAPAPSFQFGGWSGALTGLANPRTITMNGNKTVTATFTGGNAVGKVLHKETKVGYASNALSVSTATPLLGANNQLYLAAISTKPQLGVTGVTGLGLNWAPVKFQCSGRNGNNVQLWMAQGIPAGNDAVTAAFSDSAANAIIIVARYFGTHATKPLGNVISGNTNGLDGICTNGVDNASYSFNMSTSANGSLVFSAATMRSKTHSPGNGYTERAELQQGSGGNIISLAVEDKNVPAAGATTIDGSFNGVTDWAMVAVEVRPIGAPTSNTKFTLTTNTVGSGTVSANPAPVAGSYNSGTIVTLTAIPQGGTPGFKFSGWSGDINHSANPATLNMNANKIVTATFTALPPKQFKLTVNTFGHGSVSLSPAGGLYNEHTKVALTAVPDSGFQFKGWGGDMLGSASPDTIVMDANKNVKAVFFGSLTHGQIVNEETQIGVSSKSATVTTSENLLAVEGDLYLAAVASKPQLSVISVTGLGLNWTPVRAQCSGRNISGVEIWMAQATPGALISDNAVTATIGNPVSNMILAVTRYSGAHPTNPIGNIVSRNTTGDLGACAGGLDSPSYLLNLATTVKGALVYSAATMRSKTHAPGVGYTEQLDLMQGTGGNAVSLALEDKHFDAPATIVVDGKFNGAVDWAVAALEIKPRPYRLKINTIGPGSVSVNPADSLFAAGTVVTLTATAAAGFQFGGWSGDVNSSANPLTLTMDANKTMTATFRMPLDPNTNLAKNKPIIASATDTTQPAKNAVDGDAKNTYWRSAPVTTANPSAFLRVDLETPMPVGRVIIRWKSSYFAKIYELQVSNDDVSWTTVLGNISGKKGSQEIKFPQTTARYVRLNLTKNSTSSYRILELEIYIGSATAPKSVAEVSELAEIPTEVFLAQNYPNPFNPTTAISYGLPQGVNVTLKVYNLTGQVVATLVNRYQEAGQHEVIFNASRLPSGNYFMVLQAGDFKQVRRLVLMK